MLRITTKATNCSPVCYEAQQWQLSAHLVCYEAQLRQLIAHLYALKQLCLQFVRLLRVVLEEDINQLLHLAPDEDTPFFAIQ